MNFWMFYPRKKNQPFQNCTTTTRTIQQQHYSLGLETLPKQNLTIWLVLLACWSFHMEWEFNWLYVWQWCVHLIQINYFEYWTWWKRKFHNDGWLGFCSCCWCILIVVLVDLIWFESGKNFFFVSYGILNNATTGIFVVAFVADFFFAVSSTIPQFYTFFVLFCYSIQTIHSSWTVRFFFLFVCFHFVGGFCFGPHNSFTFMVSRLCVCVCVNVATISNRLLCLFWGLFFPCLQKN